MGLNHSPKIVTNGLVLCLDAANPKSYPGSGTTWTDLSGNGNNGTLTNGPTFSSSNGGVIFLDGVNDYVNLPLANTFLSNINIHTISCWINYQDSVNLQIIWSQTDLNGFGDTNTLFEFNLNRTSNTNKIEYLTGTATDTRLIFNQVFDTNKWYNIAATKNGTILNLYVNGIFNIGVTNAATGSSTNTEHNIGKPKDNVRYFNGKFANGLVYNRALSASEIQQNFNALRGRFGI